MKIAIVASRFPPHGELGGIEIATQYISDILMQGGHDVYIVTSGPKHIVKQNNQQPTIVRVLHPRIKFFGDLFFWLKVFLALIKIKPDIVHCQAIQMGVSGFLFKKIYKKPYVIWCHGFDVYFPWKGKRLISGIILNSAGAVVALTNHMRATLQENYKKDIIVLPNGIDLKKFQGFSKREIRDRLNIPFNQKIVIFVGGFRPVKGIAYLIEAFRVISQKVPETMLYLVGEGAERKNLENMIAKHNLEGRVLVVGQVSQRKVAEYMAAADVFVLPSLSEGFPLVILEAMASGLAIVASNVRGLAEIVKEGENGFLVEPKNPEQIAQKVLSLLKDDVLRQKISNANIQKAKEYDWDVIVRKIEKIYSNVLSST